MHLPMPRTSEQIQVLRAFSSAYYQNKPAIETLQHQLKMTFWHTGIQTLYSVPAEHVYNSHFYAQRRCTQPLEWQWCNLNDLITIICSSPWPLSRYKVGISSGQALHTSQAATAFPSSEKCSFTSHSCNTPEGSANFFDVFPFLS